MVGLETFFLPPGKSCCLVAGYSLTYVSSLDIDLRINTLGNGVNYNDPNFLQGLPNDQTYELPPDMWW
jgi:hypothetical protein